MRNFEFSNESNKAAYNGQATAAQYTAALLDWAPRLKAIKPDMLLGANGPTGRWSRSEAPGESDCWWEQVRLSLQGLPYTLVLCQQSLGFAVEPN